MAFGSRSISRRTFGSKLTFAPSPFKSRMVFNISWPKGMEAISEQPMMWKYLQSFKSSAISGAFAITAGVLLMWKMNFRSPSEK